ncbi:MAG: PAS domain S-box protein [Candidatus Hydrogenedentota bacterium]
MPLYLIPVIIGMAGVLFSRQFDSAVVRGAVVLASVTLPVFAGGRLLAHLHMKRRERFMLIGGMFLLVLGAAITLSGFTDRLMETHDIAPYVGVMSRWLGMLSLVIGLMAVLFIAVRTDEAFGELGGRFRQLAQHMSEGFVLTTPAGVIATVNPRFLEMTGLREDEAVGMDLTELAQRVGMDRILPQADNPKGGTKEGQVSWPFYGEERQFWVSSTPVYGKRGQVVGALSTLRDVTEQNRMAKSLEHYAEDLQRQVQERTRQLRQSEQHLRELLMTMNEGFVAVDGQFRIQFANDRIAQLLGVSAQAMRDKSVLDYVGPASRGKLLELFDMAAAQGGKRVNLEVNLITQDGDTLPVVMGAAPIHDSSQEGLRYSLVITDVSELKTMQRQLEMRANELEQANQELRMLDRAKDSLLSNVTHELRTPLSTIRGYIEMLENAEDDSGESRGAALEVMRRNVDRLQALIEEMLEFSRMQIRGVQLSLRLFDANTLVQEQLMSHHPQANEKGVSLESLCSNEQPPMVWGDPSKLNQVLTILLSNAIKFTETGGRVTVECSCAGSDFTLAVHDTGIGIEETHQERVFDKFYQVDSDLSRRYSGTGIGLSIAKSIVQAHGGEITVNSTPGEGSTFSFTLPHAAFRSTPDRQAERLDEYLLVLGMEDQESRQMIAAVMREAGAAVHEAGNVYECIRNARELMPDVICLDNNQSNSGEAPVTRLRHELDLRDTPVVGFCAPPNSVGASHAESESPSDVVWLSKPFTPAELRRRISLAAAGEAPTESAEGQGAAGAPRILLIDKDSDFLDYAASALRRRRTQPLCATDLDWAINQAAQFHPNLIVVDVDGIASGDPSEIVGALRENTASQNTPVCVISGIYQELSHWPEVKATLRKPFPIDEIPALLESVPEARPSYSA